MKTNTIRWILATALVLLVGGLVGCSTNSPSEPPAGGGQDPGPGASQWNVTVTANPDSLEVGTGTTPPSSQITVTVRNASGGRPGDGTTVITSATLGTLAGDAVLVNGTAAFTYTPAGLVGLAEITAQLQSSFGRTNITLRDPDDPPPGPGTPKINSFTPTTGPIEGGTEIVIRGEEFERPVQVLFEINGVDVEAEVLTVSSIRITVLSPDPRPFISGTTSLPSSIRVVNLGSGLFGRSLTPFFYGTELRITAISPSEGPPEGGQLVTISGQGFEEPVAVSMGTKAQTVVSVSPTQIIVRTSALNSDGCSDVTEATTVTNIESGASASGPNYTYKVPRLLITGVSPSSGHSDGGYGATVSGGGFVDPVKVVFGGNTASGATVNAAGTSIAVTVPQATALDEESCDDNGDGTEGTRFIDTAVDVTVENLSRPSCAPANFAGGFIYEPVDRSCRNDVGPPVVPECADGIDNDGDTFIDFPDDPECTSASDTSESS